MGWTWDLYSELVRTNFKLKYRGSILGFLWVLMRPFVTFLTLFVIFSSISSAQGFSGKSEYAMYLLIGLVVFTFINEGIIEGMNSLMQRSGIILKIGFNRFIALASSITMALINFVINLLIVSVVAVTADVSLSALSGVYLVFVILTALLMVLGISFFSSIMLIRLRDLSHIVELLMQLVFYASAIFFPITIVPERWRFIVEYNPIAVFVQAAREAITSGSVVRFDYVIGAFIFSLVLVVMGNYFFQRNVKKIAEFF
ncbi:MAG: ABC transporter permease [Candidatus Dojkabacteria bacterium]|nr:ABC transporter permease [Candidatus Dojkabacteria bacterium]